MCEFSFTNHCLIRRFDSCILHIFMKKSKSFLSYKKRVQEVLDFAVLVTLSVPVLKQNIKLLADGKITRLPDPDYFEPSVIYEITDTTLQRMSEFGLESEKFENLFELKNKPLNESEFKRKVILAVGEDIYKKHRNILKTQSDIYIANIEKSITDYRSKLSTYLYFSTFSYFEAYIIDLSKEVIADLSKIDKKEYIVGHQINSAKIDARQKLSQETDPRKKDRYIKFSKQLDADAYLVPERILFASLIEMLEEKIDDLKANEIPAFLEKTFLYKMSGENKQTFSNVRTNRNSIGHGNKSYNPNLNDVLSANHFFKKLASEIDVHVMFHFSKLANYQG